MQRTAVLAAVALVACGGRSVGPIGYSPPRAGEGGGHPHDERAAAEASPVPPEFRTKMVKLGDRFLSRGHGHRYQAVLWLNDVARAAWGVLPGEMPDGALIVEEAIEPERQGDRVAGLFVMEHRGGAWRFVVVGGDGEVVADSRVASCVACHHEAPTDSLFVEVTREGP